MTEGTDMIENVARPKLVDELALAIDQFLTHRIERDTLACDLTQDELTELATGLAAIAAMQSAPQWQGIESAPRDGSWIVIYDDRYKHSEHSYLIAQWHTPLKVWAGKKNSKGRFTLWDDATHWMPLPTPPAGGSDAE